MINVAKVINSPKFCQLFTVHRKTGGKWNAGLWEENEDHLSFSGIVVNASPKEVFQVPEGDRVSGIMAFYSTKPIYTSRARGWTENGTTTDPGTADQLEWQGDRYRVVTVNDFSDYGYYQALAVYMDGD